jgi:hypothetical protein
MTPPAAAVARSRTTTSLSWSSIVIAALAYALLGRCRPLASSNLIRLDCHPNRLAPKPLGGTMIGRGHENLADTAPRGTALDLWCFHRDCDNRDRRPARIMAATPFFCRTPGHIRPIDPKAPNIDLQVNLPLDAVGRRWLQWRTCHRAGLTARTPFDKASPLAQGMQWTVSRNHHLRGAVMYTQYFIAICLVLCALAGHAMSQTAPRPGVPISAKPDETWSMPDRDRVNEGGAEQFRDPA